MRHPPGLMVGVGCSLGCPPDELADLVAGAVAAAVAPGPRRANASEANPAAPDNTAPTRPAAQPAVLAVATVDRRADEPCVIALAARLEVPLVLHAAEALAAVAVPTPSATVLAHVGTPSVAEAAALLTAGPGAELLVPKRRAAHATCAVARRPT